MGAKHGISLRARLHEMRSMPTAAATDGDIV